MCACVCVCILLLMELANHTSSMHFLCLADPCRIFRCRGSAVVSHWLHNSPAEIRWNLRPSMGMIPTFHLEKHVQTASGSFASTSPQGATGIAISAAWLVFLLTFSKQTRELLRFKGQNRSPSMIVTKKRAWIIIFSCSKGFTNSHCQVGLPQGTSGSGHGNAWARLQGKRSKCRTRLTTLNPALRHATGVCKLEKSSCYWQIIIFIVCFYEESWRGKQDAAHEPECSHVC